MANLAKVTQQYMEQLKAKQKDLRNLVAEHNISDEASAKADAVDADIQRRSAAQGGVLA